MPNQPFFYPALIIGLVSVPLVLALIPKNRFYGVRTRETLSDERIWYAVNRIGGSLLLASSILYIAFSALWPMSGTRDLRLGLWLAHLGMFSIPLLISTLWTIGYARQLYRLQHSTKYLLNSNR